MKKIYITSLFLMGIFGFAQIKNETIILDRKREPEVRRIEKKKTDVEVDKNSLPEKREKEKLSYQLVNVPVVSDFKPSNIAGVDIEPKINNDFQRNYFQIGYGNYGQFLSDGHISGNISEKTDIGLDVHYLSNHGLKKNYSWNSSQWGGNVTGFMNFYGENGRFHVDADFGLKNHHYYGISEGLLPEANVDLSQRTTKFQVNGYYDHYSNEILNDIKVKSSFLKDRFGANENYADVQADFSKHELAIGGITLNTDLNTGLEVLGTKYDIVERNQSNYLNFSLTPKATFYRGESYLTLGSEVDLLSGKQSSLNVNEIKEKQFYWFPKAELLLSVRNGFKFYGGIDGGLKLNTYSDLLEENPFLLSDLELLPTRNLYHFYFGMKGDFSEKAKYDVQAGFGKFKNKAFFFKNSLFEQDLSVQDRKPYDFSNTFSTIYDDGSLSEIKGIIQYFPIQNLILEGELTFHKYLLNQLKSVYYQPIIQLGLGAKYTMLNDKLQFSAKGYFMTNRTGNGYHISIGQASHRYEVHQLNDTNVSGYVDLNLSVDYQINKNISIFASGMNLLGEKYQTFQDYKVLGTQILAGVKLKF